jgi:hypothetical protein
MAANLFDANFYRAANADLANFNDAQALSHFQNYGLNEGRAFSPFVNLNFYRSSNSDLASFNNQQAFDHLQNNGVSEGRRFSQFVDLNFYQTNNHDLAGFNNEQAFGHLQSYGVAEGRRFSQFVDFDFYRASNHDLASFNNSQALQHLEINGLGERRRFSQFVDLNYYAANNPDLVTAGLSNRQLLEHFEINGLGEGRSFSLNLDVNYYRAVYSDLASANMNNRQLYEHFQLNGLGEGRASSQFFNVGFYRSNNLDLASLNNSQAFQHFLTYGQHEGRRGSEAGSFLTGREISTGIDIRNGSQTINASLTSSDRANPTRTGSYSDDYRLMGIDVGQQVQLNMNAGFDTYLQLVNASSGQVITFDDDSGEGLNSELRFTAQFGIDYIVRATSYNSQAIGNYTLTASAASTIAGSITANQTFSGALSCTDFVNSTRSGRYRDDYRLTGVSAGQPLQVNMNAAFDTYLQLVNASTGEVISYNDDSNGTLNSELRFTAQSGINYIIRATSYASNATGSYTLSTTSTSATISSNQSINGALDSTDLSNPLRSGRYRDDYTLTGTTAGQQIRLNLNAGFDTYLQLVNASSGQEISSNDNSNGTLNSELTFTVQSGVNYTIRVTSFSSNSTGAYTLTTTPLSATDWFTQNIRDAQLQTIARNRASDGMLDRNDMLAIFRDAQDSSAIAADEVSDLRTLVANSARFRMADYVQYLSGRVADGASANMSASTFESSLVGRWFLGTIAPTGQFNSTPLTHTAVQGSLYGSAGRAVIGDIDQGSLGDCAFLAALGATFARQSNDSGNTRSSVIDSMIIDNSDNTYTIRFYSGSSAEYVTVDRRLATTNNRLFGASANGSRDPNNTFNVLWAPLVERAYAQWREGREGAPGYNLIGNGDNLVRPLQFVTGLTATNYSTSSLTFSTLETAFSNARSVETGRLGSDTTYIVGGHAYSVTNAYTSNSQQRVVVRNPWGVDGLRVEGSNDGFIDMSYSDFVSNFNFGVAIA